MMMIKKLSVVFIIIAVVLSFSIQAFALGGTSATGIYSTGNSAVDKALSQSGSSDDATATMTTAATTTAADDNAPKSLVDIVRSSDDTSIATDQFIVKVAKPSANEITNVSSYVVCGTTDTDNVRFIIAIYNSALGIYQTVEGSQDENGDSLLDLNLVVPVDGKPETLNATSETSHDWTSEDVKPVTAAAAYANTINSFGLFTKTIQLSEGGNRIKVIAYTDSALTSPDLGTNIQVSCYTVTYLSDSIKDRLLKTIFNFTQFFKRLF